MGSFVGFYKTRLFREILSQEAKQTSVLKKMFGQKKQIKSDDERNLRRIEKLFMKFLVLTAPDD